MGRSDGHYYEEWDWDKWFADPDLARTRVATRGCWAEWNGRMWQDDQHTLKGTLQDFARLARTTVAVARAALLDLERTGTAEITRNDSVTERYREITLCSRKRLREWEQRKACADKQKRYRARKKGDANGESVTPRDRHKRKEKKRIGNANVTRWHFVCRACRRDEIRESTGELQLCPCGERMEKCSPATD